MPTTDSRWKEKYSRLLDEYERLERNTTQRAQLLERGLVRSSLAAEGQDNRLDKHLQALRDSVRNTNSGKLQHVVDDIERYLLATDNQRQERQTALVTALDALSSQLLASSQDHHTRQALKKLQATINDSQQLNLNLHHWLFELSQLQAEILQQSALDCSQPGLLDRLFGRTAKPQADAPQETDIADSASLPATESAANESAVLQPEPLPSPPASHEHDSGLEELCRALAHLLDGLPLSGQDPSLANDLRQQLTDCNSWHSLGQILPPLTGLLNRANTQRQQEFGDYLQQLNSKLSLITHSVSQTRDSYQKNIDSAADLDLRLHSQVSELHQDVQQTNDLGELKQRVDQRLNQFVQTLQQHQQQRKESEERLMQRLQELGERVHLVENEASQLTSQLVEQHEKARRDALTGLPNRAAWDERLQIEYQRMQRQQESLLLAVLDVDHFKRINDTYGHLAGDKVLKILAGRLQQGIRKTDFMARYGGEEFVLLLPDTGLKEGVSLLNKLREHIAGCPFHFKGEPVQITFSAGIGQLQASEDPATTFALVDQALYAAKQGGRNQVKSAAVNGP